MNPGKEMKLVSIIVPVYNSQNYLSECLESLQKQSHKNIEIICVDDGSPDQSIAILEQLATTDARFNIVRQENRGLGAARNRGVLEASGEMIWFVDSDDTVPPNAAEKMIGSLEVSGSDFVVGSIVRETVDGQVMRPWVKALHKENLKQLTISDNVDILKNVFACTKMFRRKFFLDTVKSFPAGLYEDQLPSVRAYFNGTFDIIKDVVYNWRIREDGSSITQQKSSINDLKERWRVIDTIRDEVADYDQLAVQALFAKIIGFDMRLYYQEIPEANDDYWKLLQAKVKSFLDAEGLDLLSALKAYDRLLAVATYHGFREDVRKILLRREKYGWAVPGTIINHVPQIRVNFFDELELQPIDIITRLEIDNDLSLFYEVNTAEISDESFVIQGYAYFKNLSQSFENTKIIISVEKTVNKLHFFATKKIVYADVTLHKNSDAVNLSSDPWNDHLESGFKAVFSLAELGNGHWDIKLTLVVGSLSQTETMRNQNALATKHLNTFGRITNERRWYLIYSKQTDGLQLRQSITPQLPVESGYVENGKVNFILSDPTQLNGGQFFATNSTSKIEGVLFHRDNHTGVSFDLPLDITGKTSWKFWKNCEDYEIQLAWPENKSNVSTSALRPFLGYSSSAGNIQLDMMPVTGEITNVSLSKKSLKIKGWINIASNDNTLLIDIKLHNKFTSGVSVPLKQENGDFSAELPLINGLGEPLSLRHGFAVVINLTNQQSYWPRVSSELSASLPIKKHHDNMLVKLTKTPKAGGLWVKLTRPH